MKRALIPAGLLLAACLIALPAVTAEIDAPDGLTIDNFKAETKNLSVEFNHSAHEDYECVECHHTWDPGCGEPPRPCSFSGCHDVMDKRDKTEASYYKTIHDMRPDEISTCVSCHREVAGDDREKKKELAGCRGSVCHP